MNLRFTRITAWLLTRSLLLLAVLITFIPFLWLVAASFKSNEEFFRSTFLPMRETSQVAIEEKNNTGGGIAITPHSEAVSAESSTGGSDTKDKNLRRGWGIAWERLTIDAYRRLFVEVDFGRGLINSIFLSSVTGVLATLCCAMGGYALARFNFKGRGFCTALVLAAVLIPGPLLLAPGYQLLYNLGLLDSFAGLILPAIAPAFGVFLFRQAVMSAVPTDLLEAARIDGAGEWRTFMVVVLPLVRPMIGTFLMITFLGVWNNFIGPQVVLQSPDKFPLSVAVAELKRGYYSDYGLQMAGTVVSILPVMILFLLMQKDFVSGLAAGAVKG